MDDSTANLIAAEIPRLRRVARFMSRDALLADDLVEECLERAVSQIDTWKRGTNLRPWLLALLRSFFVNEFRHARRVPVTGPQYDVPHDPEHASANPKALDGIQEPEPEFAIYLAAARRAFDRLSDEHREILLLVAIEELSYEDTASVLNLPIGTVRSRLLGARAALRELMPGGAQIESEATQSASLPAL
jgi:RNA polymerase sigma-70 factor (ECF subfamily)